MTGHKSWHNDGLGETGEVYLVGEDLTMRSTSRRLLEDSKNYQKLLQKSPLNSDKIAQIMSLNNPVGYQKIDTEASKLSIIEGKTGRQIVKNEYSESVLSAFAPLKITGLNWGIIAQKNVAEVDKPILEFEHTLLISAVLQAAFIALISLYLAHQFVQPIGKLIKGLQRISAGDTQFKLRLNRHDEFGELADTFNEMTENLNQQQNKIKQQTEEKKQLLANSLPNYLISRFDKTMPYIAETYHDVAVLSLNVGGLSYADIDTNPIMHEWTLRFYEICQEFDADNMTPVGNLYISACGLSVPRLDQAKRCVDLALALFQEMARLNLRYSLKLYLSIGIHRGEVYAGILGDQPFSYNIWGEVVQFSQRLSLNTLSNNLKITEVVHQQLIDSHEFIETQPLVGSKLKLWLMQAETQTPNQQPLITE